MQFEIVNNELTGTLDLAKRVGEPSQDEPTVRMDCIMFEITSKGSLRIGGVGRVFSFATLLPSAEVKGEPGTRFFLKNQYVDSIKALKPSTRKKDPVKVRYIFDAEDGRLTVVNLDNLHSIVLPLETDTVQLPLLQAATKQTYSRRGTQHWVTLPPEYTAIFQRGMYMAGRVINAGIKKQARDHEGKIVRLAVRPLNDQIDRMTGYLSAFGLSIVATNRRRFCETYIPLVRRDVSDTPENMTSRELAEANSTIRAVLPVPVMEQADAVAYEPVVALDYDHAEDLAKLLDPEQPLRLYINFIATSGHADEKPLTMVLTNGGTIIRVTTLTEGEVKWNLDAVQTHISERHLDIQWVGQIDTGQSTKDGLKLALSLGYDHGVRLVCDGPDSPLRLISKGYEAEADWDGGLSEANALVDGRVIEEVLKNKWSVPMKLGLAGDYLVMRDLDGHHQVLSTTFKD